jgi:hypothetical protein
MKHFYSTLTVIFLIPIFLLACSSGNFDDHFYDKTMRIDYFHMGDAKEELVTIDRIYDQGIWAGSKENLIDSFDIGRYYVKIYDSDSGEMIFSKGFDSYFGEYKTTDPALKGIKRTYHESVLIPYPKKKIKFSLERRNRENVLIPLFAQEVDPLDVGIIKESLEEGVKVIEVVRNGTPSRIVDIVIIGEGYKADEEEKFRTDLERYTEIFFNWEPYKTYRDRFNVYGVFKPSTDSGCDEPRKRIFKNTVINSSFNSMNLERYLLIEDNKSLRDVAAHAPYDAIFVMANIKRYGGGGIYNQYCIFTSDGEWNEHVFHHEFGHSFGGLADEYYAADIAYSDFYPKGIEPKEPNITALLDPKNIKWKELVTPGTEIPTPWEKEEFDSLYLKEQQVKKELRSMITQLKEQGASDEEIEEVRQKHKNELDELNKNMKDLLLNSPFRGKVGAFEGAGFSAKGLYRPMLNCLMLKYTEEDKNFCKVCEHAVIRIIKHYSE